MGNGLTFDHNPQLFLSGRDHEARKMHNRANCSKRAWVGFAAVTSAVIEMLVLRNIGLCNTEWNTQPISLAQRNDQRCNA
jgi:hypothetical protein